MVYTVYYGDRKKKLYFSDGTRSCALKISTGWDADISKAKSLVSFVTCVGCGKIMDKAFSATVLREDQLCDTCADFESGAR